MEHDRNHGPRDMIFGLNRAEDERSMVSFLEHFCSRKLTSVLVPRMTDEEIVETVDLLATLMRNHLNHREYHTLFLGEHDHRH
jgi:hypothetical protein